MVVAAAQQYDSSDNRPYRMMSEENTGFLRISLEEMRRNMIQNVNYSPTKLPVNILTGLSDKVIKNIVSNAYYFLDPADIYGEYVLQKLIVWGSYKTFFKRGRFLTCISIL